MKDVRILKNGGVNVDASLELFGDMETYDATLEDFLGAVNQKLEDLEKFKTATDMPNYAILVHSLKSDAKYFGFTALAELSYEHEMKSKANNMYYVYDHFNELLTEANRIIDLVCKYLGKSSIVSVRPTEVAEKNDNLGTILVVDDSNIVRIFIEKVFKNEYNVMSATDGNEAISLIEKADENNIVAMLLDLNMPNCNGIEVLNYFKEHNLFTKIPVSIITGEDSNETIEEAANRPVAEVLTKPFNERDIKRVVEKTINFNKVM